MYTLAYKKSNNTSSSDNISSFKIQGNSLNYMYITPVEDCVVDFGDGQQQTFTGNNSSTQVTHSYSESNIYTIKIIGNHSNFQASRNTIEVIQLANSVTDCENMFFRCKSLTAIPSTFTLGNSVTNCSYMFNSCSSLTAIPETLTIPNSVTDCSYMFKDCSSLTEIPSTLTIPNSVTNCSSMFRSCSSLTEIPETLIIPDSVTDCGGMFQWCKSLTAIPETLIIPDSVTHCTNMFFECSSLTTIPSTFTIPDSVTHCANMFYGCSSLTSDISNIWPKEFTYTGTIDISNMFLGCSKVVGTVPADKLWNSGKTFSPDGCFDGCILLSNYNDIPAGWK